MMDSLGNLSCAITQISYFDMVLQKEPPTRVLPRQSHSKRPFVDTATSSPLMLTFCAPEAVAIDSSNHASFLKLFGAISLHFYPRTYFWRGKNLDMALN